MLTVKTLEGVTSSELYEIYKEAFCDYPVDLGFDERKLMLVLHKLGGDMKHSFGAFEDDKLIGFASCGIRQFEGRPTGYVALTGVSVHHRRGGAGRAMMEAAREHFIALGLKHFMLEVIDGNDKAYELYRKVGFGFSRAFTSYKLPVKPHITANDFDICTVSPEDAPWDALSAFWDFSPCWQNSTQSIMDIPDIELIAIAYENGEPVGYAACSRFSCSIDHIAVAHDRRRRGIGTALVDFIAKNTPSEGMSISNVDMGCESLKAFVVRFGFEKNLSLHELTMEL